MSEGCSPCVEAGSSTLGSKSVKQSSWVMSSSNLGTSSVFMCQEVKGPLRLARAVPDVDRAIRVIGEEAPKGLDNKGSGPGLSEQKRQLLS